MLKFLVLSAVLALAVAIPKPGHSWESDCGKSKYPDAGTPQFVVGGQEARENEFPFQVMLRYLGSFFCGGSVLNAGTTLTAAHCTSGDSPSLLTVVVGKHSRIGTDDTEETIEVQSNTVHPRYDETGNIEYDVALLGFTSDLTFNDNVQPVCPPANSQADNEGVNAFVAGWGNTASGGGSPTHLHFAHDIPIMDHDACKNCFLNPNWVDETMICAGICGNNAKDTCQGDSGGPLFIKNDDDLFEQVGITSWGIGCAGDTPGVYADVFFLKEWIDEEIDGL